MGGICSPDNRLKEVSPKSQKDNINLKPKNMKDYIRDITGLINNARGDYSALDFIEGANEIIAMIQKEIEEAQEEINQDVEELVDSFGGKDLTMRSLKGE
jgi:uncharacterized membrane-anchored protein YhcB (DUF1043 family)